MATTRITATRNGMGKNGLDYATKQGEPHNSDNPKVTQRVMMLGAVNCSIANFKSQMQAVWQANNTKRKKQIELYRITQSFSTDELDVNNPDDVIKCNAIGVETAKRLYPDKLVVVATQADGKGGKLHNHIDVCSPGFVDGKALRAERTNQGHIAYVSDSVCKDYGLIKPSKLPDIKPNQLRSKSGRIINFNKQNIARNGKSSFLVVLQNRIMQSAARDNITSFDDFKKSADKNGVDVKIRQNKKGKINGLSYKLKNGSHKRAVRASKLGTKFEAEFLQSLFDKHLVTQQQAQRDNQRLINQLNIRRKKEEEEKKRQQLHDESVNKNVKKAQNHKKQTHDDLEM